MTMIAVVRTSSDVVIAADSKITTVGIVGKEPDGSFKWGPKSYNHGTKIVVSASGGLVCVMAGTLGMSESPIDYFRSLHLFSTPEAQSFGDAQAEEVRQACLEFGRRRAEFQKSLNPDPATWSQTVLILAAHHPERWCPRVWEVTYSGEEPDFQEILVHPGVCVQGSYSDAMCLLWGMHLNQMSAVGSTFEKDFQSVLAATMSVLRPMDKINFHAMPLQDAVDFAHFLVTVQVQMDRYVADQEACGGPIDMAIVYGNPRKKVRFLPGKETRHPGVQLSSIVSDAEGRMP